MTPKRWPRPSAGFALVELLIAAAVTIAVVGVMLRMAAEAHTVVRTAGERADLQQRLRVAVEALRRDLLAAGGGPPGGAAPGPLIDAFAPVLPARTGTVGADADLSYADDRASIVSMPRDGSATTLARGMSAPGDPLFIDPGLAGCPSGGLCGFRPGDRLLVHAPDAGDGARDVFTVVAVDAASSSLTPDAPLSRTYAAGSQVLSIVQRVYHLDRPGRRLMVYDGDGSDVPLVDHVVDLRFAYFADPAATGATPPAPGRSNCAYAAGPPPVPRLGDLGGTSLVRLTAAQLTDGPACGGPSGRFDADLLRVRRIDVTLRLEAEGAEFRGAGAGFANRGTSLEAGRSIPDLQISISVAPRNMGNAGLR